MTSNKTEQSKYTNDDTFWLKKIDGKFIKRSEKYAKKGIAKVGVVTFNLKLRKKLLSRREKNNQEERNRLRSILKSTEDKDEFMEETKEDYYYSRSRYQRKSKIKYGRHNRTKSLPSKSFKKVDGKFIKSK